MKTFHRLGSRILFALLHCASLLVPVAQREEWFAEWKGELAFVLRTHSGRVWLAWNGPAGFCFGAFYDALWLAKHRQRTGGLSYSLLRMPLRCLGVLFGLASTAWLATTIHISLAGVPHPEFYQRAAGPSIGSFLVEILIAAMILPSITSLSMGDYPQHRSDGRRTIRWQPQLFLLAKILLIFVLAYDAGELLTHLLEWVAVVERWPLLARTIRDFLPPVQPIGCCLACLYGLRWVLRDQRQRCPACLHLLSSPARVGPPSHNFLSWNGTELICRGGHGLLHVPELQMSWMATQTWQELDPSWQALFPK